MNIVLKKFSATDFSDYFRLVSDERVMAMITERSIPETEAREDFAKILQINDRHPDAGYFRIMDAARDEFIGLGKLEIPAIGAGEAELGYMILPAYWGQGVAGSVATILIRRARMQLDVRGLFAVIDPANVPSRKILINNGFYSREFKDFDGLPGEVLGLTW